jgi:hypothetical protein
MRSKNYDTSHYEIFSGASSLSGSNIRRLNVRYYYVGRREVVEWLEGFRGELMSFVLASF